MRGPDEDDVIEQGGPPPWLAERARRLGRPPGLGRRRSRGAAWFGLAALIVALAAGYALGGRPAGQPSRPAPPAAARTAPAVDLFGLAQTGERPHKN